MIDGEDDADATTPFADGGTRPTVTDWTETDSATVAITEAVAKATGRDPLELPPLYEHVEAEALDALLSTAAEDHASLHVSFVYDSVEVTIESNGDLTIWADEREE